MYDILATDKLFKQEIELTTTSTERTVENSLHLYSEGYKEAGYRLYKFSKENSYYENWIIFPIVFNYRHYVELKLKELIYKAHKYLDNDNSFPNEHSLLKLWEIYRNKILPKIESNIDTIYLKQIERIISEFHNKDPKSMKYRYPINHNDHESFSLDKPYFELENFIKVVNKLIHFFNEQSLMINNYSELKSIYESQIYLEWE
ncbi:hypothetical protein ACW5R3_12375 [Bizionia sp. KMM 8389]